MLKRNLIILLILIIIAGVVVFFSTGEKIQDSKQVLDYKDQATHVVIREFDANNTLTKKIIAEKWTNFEDKKYLITKPQVQISDKNLHISADFAQDVNNDTMELIGNVKIVSNGNTTYNLNTQSLIADMKRNYFHSNTKVEYFSHTNKITSQGIKVFLDDKKVELLKDSVIIFANGNKIFGENITIIQKNNLDYLSSNNPAEFISDTSKANSNKGFFIYKNHTNLLGKSIITQDNALIYANELKVFNNIYSAQHTEYHKEKTQVNADNLKFDDTTQIIELNGNVRGTYE